MMISPAVHDVLSRLSVQVPGHHLASICCSQHFLLLTRGEHSNPTLNIVTKFQQQSLIFHICNIFLCEKCQFHQHGKIFTHAHAAMHLTFPSNKIAHMINKLGGKNLCKLSIFKNFASVCFAHVSSAKYYSVPPLK